MNEALIGVLTAATSMNAVAVSYLMVEKVKLVRAHRRAKQVESTALEAMGRGMDEFGRKLASGDSLQGLVTSAVVCRSPNCPEHGGKDGGGHGQG